MPRHSRCNRLTARTSFIRTQPIVSSLIESALVPPRAGLAGRVAVERMADDFRKASQREGGLSRADMKLMGWSDKQIDTIGDAANLLAQQLAGASA